MPAPHDNPFDRPAFVPQSRQKRQAWPVMLGVSAALAAVLSIVLWASLGGNSANAPPKLIAEEKRNNAPTADTVVPRTPATKAPPPVDLVDDDGRTMWASPTAGKPLDFAYLPPGVQIVLALRPAQLAAHPEGEKVLASLGPLGGEATRAIEQLTGLKFAQIERLVVGWQFVGDTGNLVPTLVVYPSDQAPAVAFEESLPGAKKNEHLARVYWENNARAYYRPSQAAGPALVVAPAESIKDILELAGQAPPLRRDVARLLAQTDADRQLTMVVTPGTLFGEGREMFTGEMLRLRQALFWFLGDELSAAALSLHWDDNFFAEVVATSTLDVQPGRAAQQLADRVARMPELIETYIVSLDASSYSRRVVARLPGMVRKLSTYTRSGFGRDFVALRAYLPAIAGHNLLMGTELALAENPASSLQRAGSRAQSTTQVAKASLTDQLNRKVSLRVPRDSLETVLNQLSQVVGVEIVIRGSDLQLDGITKNQSLSIDADNQPAADILVQILRLANPDKSAASPADSKQKLVYVIGPKSPGGPDVVFVTTRSKAAERGEQLPPAFVGN